MKKEKIEFKPLNQKDQNLIKRYAEAIEYDYVLNNEIRRNIIVDGHGKVYLIIKKKGKLYCYRKNVLVPITNSKVKEIEIFVNGFRHLNMHKNIVRMIYGLFWQFNIN